VTECEEERNKGQSPIIRWYRSGEWFQNLRGR